MGNDSRPICIKDTCAHRACPLSLGKVENGEVSCAYHGWKFAYDGQCTSMPSTMFVKDVGVDALPCVIVGDIIWVYPGEREAPHLAMLDITTTSPNYDVYSEFLVDLPVRNETMLENIMDLSSNVLSDSNYSFSKWSLPQVLSVSTAKLFGGTWYLYPVALSFIPPCTILSTIGLSQLCWKNKTVSGLNHMKEGYRVKQVFICTPAGKNASRLLYRMSVDFIPWGSDLPFFTALWKFVAKQVLQKKVHNTYENKKSRATIRFLSSWVDQVPYEALSKRYKFWKSSFPNA